MHFLILTGIFHPEAGGPATYLYQFLPELLRCGHTVEVITFGEGETASYPYPVTRIPRTNFLKRNLAYFLAARRALPRADRVYIHSLGLPLPPIHKPKIVKIVGDLAWERAIRRGWIPSDEDIDRFQVRGYHPLAEWGKWSRSREIRHMDRVIVPSEYLQKMVIGWGVAPERVQVIYNAYEGLRADSPLKSRSDLGLPEDKPMLLTVARLTAWKGVAAVLEAITPLSDIHYVIAGDGPVLETLKQQAASLSLENRVHFLGNVPRQHLRHYYAAADYKVLYSGYEGLSHVLLEALDAGTPIIASDKGGNPEVVQHGKNGFLVPYRDVSTLRQAIQTALAGETPRQMAASLIAKNLAGSALSPKQPLRWRINRWDEPSDLYRQHAPAYRKSARQPDHADVRSLRAEWA